MWKPDLRTGHLICFGYGYTARYLASYLKTQGWRVSATMRSVNLDTIDQVTLIDFENFDTDLFSDITHVLVSIPPGPMGDIVLSKHKELFLENDQLDWIGYLSTTGVYGDTGGILVDEDSRLNPTHERSKLRLLAEQAWLGLNQLHNLPVHVFRLAGIYGPGRNILEQIRAGKAQRIDSPDHKFSRIHVGDIINVLGASIAEPEPGEVYNVCDDGPATLSEIIEFACELLDVIPPAPITINEAMRNMSPMAQAFWSDNRLVDNSKIKTSLKVLLTYPTYKEGLKAIFESNDI